MAARRRRQDWSRPLGPSPSRFANQAYWSGVPTPPDTSMQALGLSLTKGRLGSIRNGGKSKPRPNAKAPEARSSGAPRRTRTSNAAAAAIEGVRPGSDLADPNRRARGAVSCRRQRRSSRAGMRDAPPRKEPRTDIPSSPRSRQARVVGEQPLVKAGLRPPPPAASALTRLRSPTSGAAREIEGSERSSSHSHAPRAQTGKSATPLLTKKPPYEPDHEGKAGFDPLPS